MKKQKPILFVKIDMASISEIEEVRNSLSDYLKEEYHIIVSDHNTDIELLGTKKCFFRNVKNKIFSFIGYRFLIIKNVK